jgi:hypothetical protein
MRVLVLMIVLLVSVAASAGEKWVIDWYTIDAGGTLSASGDNWELKGTIGQADATAANELSGGSLQLTGGFWGVTAEILDQIFRDRFEAVPITFSTHLAVTFRHPRCTTCHAVAATDFQRVNDDPPGVLPASHPIVNASTDCTSCHTASLLPPGNIDPGWQSAPSAFDFRDKTDGELCDMASQPVSGHSPLEHMSEDRLVLWAVGDGRVPFGNPDLPTAPPHDIDQWRDLIQQWVSGGMPCQ